MTLPDLNIVRNKLKERFIGLDGVIDQFIENVRVWYETADLMERPLVINLWGLTGSGKTSLVRSFVEFAGLTDHFLEIQFSGDKDMNISRELQEQDLDEDDYVVLLLDEFQNFRTVDHDGTDMTETGYDDLWLLLSDGILDTSKKMRKELEIIYLRLMRQINRQQQDDDDEIRGIEVFYGDDFSEKYLTVSQAVEFRRLFRLKMDLNEVLDLSQEDRLKIIEQALSNPNHPVFKPRVFKKLLVIISGNLNEMYEFSEDVDTFDIDPDILHNFSKTLSIIDVKNALIRKFKPEQISRLGNIHIIFPAFSRQDYYRIISKYLDEFFERVKNKYNLQITYEQSLVDYIFRNSVFPSQGARPILSGLNSLVFSKIPVFIKQAKEKIVFAVEKNCLIDRVTGTKVELYGVLDNIRKNISPGEQLLTSVHEAGHALLHSLLFGFYPHRISCAAANKANKGVTTGIPFLHNRENIKKYITTLYGGHIAEQLVFGQEKTSAYAEHDLAVLTRLAAVLVRKQGLDGFQYVISVMGTMESDFSITDKFGLTNKKVRRLLKKQYKLAKDLLVKHKPLFIDIVENLNRQGVLTDEQLDGLFKKHGLTGVRIKKDNVVFAGNLLPMWDKFKQG